MSLIRRLLDSPSSWVALDRVAAPLRRAVQAPPEPVRRALNGTWLGHPTHPIMVQVTIGCYVGAAVLDVLSLAAAADRKAGWREASTALLAVGLASTGASVATGLANWADLRPDQQRLGLVHAAVNTAGTAMAGSVVARRRGSEHRGTPWGSVAVISGVSVGAALGGHLAYRFAAGPNHADDVAYRAGTEWVEIGDAAEFELRRPVRRIAAGADVVVVRTEDGLHVLAQRCAHQGGPLDEGSLQTVRGRECLVCPWHGSAFDLSDGETLSGPSVYPQPRFEVREDADGGRSRVLVRAVEQVPHQLA